VRGIGRGWCEGDREGDGVKGGAGGEMKGKEE